MKPITAICLLMGLGTCSISFAQTNRTDGFTIKGNLSGDVEGKKVYLSRSNDGARKIADSTVIKKGTFEFKGKVDFPQLYTISIPKKGEVKAGQRPPDPGVISLFVENAPIAVKAAIDSLPSAFDLYYGGSKVYDKVNVKGSASHALYVDFVHANDAYAKQSRQKFDDYIAYLNPGKDKEKGPISKGVAIVGQIDEAKAAQRNQVKAFVKQYNSNPVSLHVAYSNLGSFSVKEIDALLASLSSDLKASAGGKQLLERAAVVKKTAEGAKYADFDFKDDKGNPVKLSEHLGKGKYVLLEFWASWCGPCRADIPHLKSVYELYHPAGFEVISVSMDDDKAKWLKAISDEQMKWLQVSDLKAFQGEFSKLYNFNGIPTCLLIGPNGDIITRNMRGSWMDKKLIELYGNKFGAQF